MEISKIQQQMALERAKFEHERSMKLLELQAGPDGGLVEMNGQVRGLACRHRDGADDAIHERSRRRSFAMRPARWWADRRC